LLRVLPSQQRLDGGHRARLQVVDRLVEQAQLVLLDRPTQPQLGLQPVRGLHAQRLVEDVHALLPPTLRAVHGQVGVAEQVFGHRVV
jgi:ABC-type phosphonate transport system ATPase subunit